MKFLREVRETVFWATLRACILAGLFLADERIFIFGLGFEDNEREAFLVEEKEIDKPFLCLLEVFTESVKVGRFDDDAGFKPYVCRGLALCKKPPARSFEQLVDLNACCCFFCCHFRFLSP